MLCRDCHKTWTGLSRAHCTVCHETFNTDPVALLHWNRAGHIDPETIPDKISKSPDGYWRRSKKLPGGTFS